MKAHLSRSIGPLLISGVLFALFASSTFADDSTVPNNQLPALAQSDSNPEDLRLSVWDWKSGGELVLFANGEARHTEWPRNGSWEVLSSGTLVLTHPNGLNFFVTFSDEKNALIVSAKGGRTSITLRE